MSTTGIQSGFRRSPNRRKRDDVVAPMRRLTVLTALTLTLAACGADAGTESAPSSSAETTQAEDTTTTSAGSPATEGVSALDALGSGDLPGALVDPSEVISGGPPPDGIPPLDAPVFRSIEESEDSLDETEPVIALEIDGDARAYPVDIMIWHEIANDTVGGVPVAVTYCPLCNSAVTFERTIDGMETTFGTSGSLYASALVMYDRATESLWTHLDGRAIAGELAGIRLEPVPSPLLSWADFKAAYPDGQVLSRETGFNRNYGQNPYFGYDNPDTEPFLFLGTPDDRARAKQRVVGVEVEGASTGFALEAVSGGEARATMASVGDTDIAIFWKAGQNTALEGADTADGRDVGSVAVFIPAVDGQPLTFAADGDAFVDAETGSTWDITGRAIAGELEGSDLEQLHHLDTFWFAWSTYQPGTELVE
jgi:hypothetical protein